VSGAVAAAVARLRSDGVLSEAQAAFLTRVARGELLSVRLELQLLLWAGVSLIAAGAGLLVKTHYDQIGPLAVTLLLTAATSVSFLYVVRHLPAFSWGEVPSPTLAFDYLLLLGVLLLGTDIAWIEYRWTLLGTGWPWHLLIVSLVCLPIAYRCDSRAVLSLALTTFAAWRGVSLTFVLNSAHRAGADLLRTNALAVGALFLAAAAATRLLRRKPHFEEVYGNIGLALLLGALFSGTFGRTSEPLWGIALFAAAGLTTFAGWWLGRGAYFAFGVCTAYAGFLRFFLDAWHDEGAFLTVAASAGGIIWILVASRKRFGGEP
jgi:hypothetical protein